MHSGGVNVFREMLAQLISDSFHLGTMLNAIILRRGVFLWYVSVAYTISAVVSKLYGVGYSLHHVPTKVDTTLAVIIPATIIV